MENFLMNFATRQLVELPSLVVVLELEYLEPSMGRGESPKWW